MSEPGNPGASAQGPPQPWRVGAPPFLCARPLTEGLERRHDVALSSDAPRGLAESLEAGRLDAALVSSIDLQRGGRDWAVLPAGCVAAAGPTVLARIFSRVPPAEVQVMWVDRACPTAAALGEIVLAVGHDCRPCIVPFDPAEPWEVEDVQAVLLVGDRVVLDPPIGFDWQWDPAAMWFEITGLPLVFSVWAAAEAAGAEALQGVLAAARARGCGHLPEIAARAAEEFGWPADLALRCLTRELHFDLTDDHREGLDEFFGYAADCGLLDTVRPLHYA